MGGGGGKSSSKTSNNTTNVSGQNAIQGDNLGVTVSGINNSHLNLTTTDHGAVNGALEYGKTLTQRANSMFSESLDSLESSYESMNEVTENVTREAIQGAQKSLDNSLDFASETVDKSLVHADRAMDKSLDFAGEAQALTFGFAGDSVKANERLTSKALSEMGETLSESFSFGNAALDTTSEANRKVIEALSEGNKDSLRSVTAMAQQSAQMAREAVAGTNKTASQSQIGDSGEMSKVAMAIAAAAGVGFLAMAVAK